MISRRQTLKSLALLSVSPLMLAACSEEGQKIGDVNYTVPEGSGKIYPLEDLVKEGALPDRKLGNEDAPVIMIEYASLTCGHCRNFHTQTYKKLKENYIDTGKVHFIYRNFPLDPRALGAAMLASCASDKLYFDIVDILFEHQRSWASAPQPLPVMYQMVAQAGFSEETFNKCLSDKERQANIQSEANRARDAFDVASTPTFFINGRMVRGNVTYEELEAILAPIIS